MTQDKSARALLTEAAEAESRGDGIAALNAYRASVEPLALDRQWLALEAVCWKLISVYPTDSELLFNLAQAQLGLDKSDLAIETLQALIAHDPNHAAALSVLGVTSAERGDAEFAETLLNRALAIEPADAVARYQLGQLQSVNSRWEDAASSFAHVVETVPSFADAHLSLGNALVELNDLDRATAVFSSALAAMPDHAGLNYAMGNLLQSQSNADEAADYLRIAVELDPSAAHHWLALGLNLYLQGNRREAINKVGHATELEPSYADAHFRLGSIYYELKDYEEAMLSFLQCVQFDPKNAAAHLNLAVLLKHFDEPVNAIEYYEKAMALDPAYESNRLEMLHQKMHVCDWSALESFAEHPGLGIDGAPVSPFCGLVFEDSPARQLARSRNWAGARYLTSARDALGLSEAAGKRIRLGLFSADFHDHATMVLFKGVITHLDRNQFTLLAFSYGVDRQDTMRTAAQSLFDEFHDVRDLTDQQIAELARSCQIDVAIDLKGYTGEARLEPFALGLAPIQVSYLGYPGSLGCDFIDYIVADTTTIPDDCRDGYSESVLYLPHCYQPNDDTRVQPTECAPREDYGLPEHGFVFCCFNASYKITPDEFNIWMELLQQVPGSVLWLLKANRFADQNLQAAASDLGVDPKRLVFADRVSYAEHLARHLHADVFLDTFNVNAHTTASDALWMGVPVLTKLGHQFAARVAGSLNCALGMDSMNVTSVAEYTELALALARDPARLENTKQQLRSAIASKALFDTKAYTRDFEAGLLAMVERFKAGKEPADIRLGK